MSLSAMCVPVRGNGDYLAILPQVSVEKFDRNPARSAAIRHQDLHLYPDPATPALDNFAPKHAHRADDVHWIG